MQVQEQSNKLSNLQLELLKLFSQNVSDEQLHDIKNMLTNYFFSKASEEFEKLAAEGNWSEATYEQWANEHNRTSGAE